MSMNFISDSKSFTITTTGLLLELFDLAVHYLQLITILSFYDFCSIHLVMSNSQDTVNSRYLEVVGTIFYKFKLPEVQINLHFG